MKHIAYPSIEQFRNAIHKVTTKARQTGADANGDSTYDHTKILPTLIYEGTIKLHGTNASIVLDRTTNELWFQSRENIITLEKDNAGFVRSFEGKDVLGWIHTVVSDAKKVVVFGEWCGGNIQPNVALAKLSKRFVVFNVLCDDNIWLGRDAVATIKSEALGIENIYDFYTERLTIDFNRPEIAQNKLSELTIKVEENCPFGKAHGIDGVGEGIVWRPTDFGWDSPEFYFKVKGSAHAQSKVITLKPVDLEKLDEVGKLTAKVTPEWRLAQMLDKACDLMNGGKIDRNKLGNFIKLVTDDVIKEETDTIKEAGFDVKDINGHIAKIARNYFFEREKVQ